jgi:hypothetical protein
MAPMPKKILIITDDAGESLEIYYAQQRWRNSVWRPNSSSPVTHLCGTCSPHSSSISKH